MLAGFTSRCTTPRACACARPSSTSATRLAICATSGRRDSASTRRERRAVDEVPDQEHRPRVLPPVPEPGDAGVVEPGVRPYLGMDAPGDRVVEDDLLERDVLARAGVMAAMHAGARAGADQGTEPVAAEDDRGSRGDQVVSQSPARPVTFAVARRGPAAHACPGNIPGLVRWGIALQQEPPGEWWNW